MALARIVINESATVTISRPCSAASLEIIHVMHARSWRQRAKQQSRQHIAKKNRLPQPPGQESTNQRRRKNHRNVLKNVGVFEQTSCPLAARRGKEV